MLWLDYLRQHNCVIHTRTDQVQIDEDVEYSASLGNGGSDIAIHSPGGPVMVPEHLSELYSENMEEYQRKQVASLHYR